MLNGNKNNKYFENLQNDFYRYIDVNIGCMTNIGTNTQTFLFVLPNEHLCL